MTVSTSARITSSWLPSLEVHPGEASRCFSSASCYVALSSGIDAGITAADSSVSFRDVEAAGLTPQQAWDTAADNLMALGSDECGIRFRLRSIEWFLGFHEVGLQLDLPGPDPGAWLAHPHTCEPIHHDLRRRFNSEVAYLLPEPGVLLAVPAASHKLPEWSQWLDSLPAAPASTPLVVVNGYPRLFQG